MVALTPTHRLNREMKQQGARLSGFSVSFATNSSFKLVFSHPMTIPSLITEVISLSENYAQEVEISLKDIYQTLTLCEVFVFGDCVATKCGWTCDIFCHCEGPIAKQNIIDANCSRGCKTGWWGDSCNNMCTSNCKSNTCNRRDGYCLECSQGKWGHFCNNTCDCNCNGKTCYLTNGYCLECYQGKWGHFCDNNCINCLQGTGCGASDGICSVGCLTGLFGINCTSQCGQCADDRSCDRSSGVCINGCLHGWHERNCTIACPLGWYGMNCSNICGHCANTTCDHINGTCPVGCSEGYNGIGCNERLTTEKNTDGSEFSPQIIGIIVGVFMCALLIGIAIGCFLMRIRMQRSASASATSALLESTYNQLDRDNVQNNSFSEYEQIQMKTRMKH